MSEEIDAPGIDPVVRVAELEHRLAEERAAASQRIIHAELKAEAIRAGMIDLDALKMVDTGQVRLGEQGELVGGAEVMRALRRAKPYLFGQANSSHPGTPPAAVPPAVKLATQMTHEEWQAARADLLRRA